LYDNSSGNLIYLHYKGVQEKATAFVTRLVNYDGDSKDIFATGGGASSIFFFPYRDNGKVRAATAQIWMRRDNQTLRMEREDWGNMGSDAILNDFYYLTGVGGTGEVGDPVFVGYENYATAGAGNQF
jgi:hypothetical protein